MKVQFLMRWARIRLLIPTVASTTRMAVVMAINMAINRSSALMPAPLPVSDRAFPEAPGG